VLVCGSLLPSIILLPGLGGVIQMYLNPQRADKMSPVGEGSVQIVGPLTSKVINVWIEIHKLRAGIC
jgi:hypothetical protein